MWRSVTFLQNFSARNKDNVTEIQYILMNSSSFFLFTELFQFTCPKVDASIGATHPRYADPDDCQFFYVCINGEQPRRNGCKLGQAFDDVSKRCDWARNIPEW